MEKIQELIKVAKWQLENFKDDEKARQYATWIIDRLQNPEEGKYFFTAAINGLSRNIKNYNKNKVK